MRRKAGARTAAPGAARPMRPVSGQDMDRGPTSHDTHSVRRTLPRGDRGMRGRGARARPRECRLAARTHGPGMLRVVTVTAPLTGARRSPCAPRCAHQSPQLFASLRHGVMAQRAGCGWAMWRRARYLRVKGASATTVLFVAVARRSGAGGGSHRAQVHAHRCGEPRQTRGDWQAGRARKVRLV